MHVAQPCTGGGLAVRFYFVIVEASGIKRQAYTVSTFVLRPLLGIGG